MAGLDYRLENGDRFVDDGRICLINNAPEHALRGMVLGR